jgi:hypothetical protein
MRNALENDPASGAEKRSGCEFYNGRFKHQSMVVNYPYNVKIFVGEAIPFQGRASRNFSEQPGGAAPT